MATDPYEQARTRAETALTNAMNAGRVAGMRAGVAVVEALARDGTASPAKLRAVASQMRKAAEELAAKLPPDVRGTLQ